MNSGMFTVAPLESFAGLLLAVMGVAVAERVIKNTHRDCRPPMGC